ncbi:MAG: recombination protein O N-terminal domain-containing protein [Patescibacteria group bacterium]
MKEYSTEAIVLQREHMGESDSRVIFYTRDFGRISAKAKSARKITSKLSAHLEPLSHIHLRLVKKGGYQITDAVRIRKLSLGVMPLIVLLAHITSDEGDDRELWSEMIRTDISAKRVLSILGFDAEYASCARCASGSPGFFLPKELIYVCRPCFSNFSDPITALLSA